MMTARVHCYWCMDRQRVQLDARRSHPCARCNPQPWQQPLIVPPFKFKRPWRQRIGADRPWLYREQESLP